MKTPRSRKKDNSLAERLAPQNDVQVEGISPKGEMPDDSRVFYRWLEEKWTNTSQLEEEAPTRYLLEELEQRGSRIGALQHDLSVLRDKVITLEVQIARLQSDVEARDGQLRSMGRDVEELQDRYRKALQTSTENRRVRRDAEDELARLRAEKLQTAEIVAELNTHVEQLMQELSLRLDSDELDRMCNRQDGVATPSETPVRVETDLESAAPTRQLVESEALAILLNEAEERAARAEQERNSQGDHYREVFAEKDNRLRHLESQLADRERRIRELEAAAPRGRWLFKR
jgi:chromosome segregation ATPase